MHRINQVIYGKFSNNNFIAVTQKPPRENLVLYYINLNYIFLPQIYGTLKYQEIKNNMIFTLDKSGWFDYIGLKR